MISSIYEVKLCPECSGSNLSYLNERDQVVCRDCGCVYEPLTAKDERKILGPSKGSKKTSIRKTSKQKISKQKTPKPKASKPTNKTKKSSHSKKSSSKKSKPSSPLKKSSKKNPTKKSKRR